MRIDGLWYAALAWLAVSGLAAAEHHGQVKFNGLPVPGATVTATAGDKKLVAVTDQQGAYSFPDLADGVWTTTAPTGARDIGQFAVNGASPLPSAQELRELIELKTEINRMYQDVAATRTAGSTGPPQQE